MNISNRALRFAALLLLAACMTLPAWAQDKPSTAIVSLYHVAPGKHLDFLKWMAARDSAATEAGAPATQWYVHMDGDSWDYLGIAPDMDDAMADKVDEIARKRGLKVGAPASIELRTMMASHTDTIAAGPMTAAQLVEAVTKP